MKSPLEKLLPTLQRETQAAREKRAAQAFELEAVRLALHQAAALGQDGARLPLPDVVNVVGTKAAQELASWCKKEGLTLTWETRQADLPERRRVTVTEPEISWIGKE